MGMGMTSVDGKQTKRSDAADGAEGDGEGSEGGEDDTQTQALRALLEESSVGGGAVGEMGVGNSGADSAIDVDGLEASLCRIPRLDRLRLHGSVSLSPSLLASVPPAISPVTANASSTTHPDNHNYASLSVYAKSLLATNTSPLPIPLSLPLPTPATTTATTTTTATKQTAKSLPTATTKRRSKHILNSNNDNDLLDELLNM